jgi:hypothetical protein
VYGVYGNLTTNIRGVKPYPFNMTILLCGRKEKERALTSSPICCSNATQYRALHLDSAQLSYRDTPRLARWAVAQLYRQSAACAASAPYGTYLFSEGFAIVPGGRQSASACMHHVCLEHIAKSVPTCESGSIAVSDCVFPSLYIAPPFCSGI